MEFEWFGKPYFVLRCSPVRDGRVILIFVVLFASFTAPGQTGQQPLGDVARSARQNRKPTTQTRRITNDELTAAGAGTKTRDETSKPAENDPESQKDTSTASADERSVSEFEAQGRVFQRQAAEQKARVAAIQKRLLDLKERLAKWEAEYYDFTASYSGADNTPRLSDKAIWCFTHQGDIPACKEWCHTPELIQEEAKAAQKDLAREQAALVDTQDTIRRHGYGSQIYDPD